MTTAGYAGKVGSAHVWVCGGEHDVADGFQGNAIVAGIEVDQGLRGCGGTVGATVDPDGPLAGSAGGCVECTLNAFPRIDLDDVPGLEERFRPERDRQRSREGADGQHEPDS